MIRIWQHRGRFYAPIFSEWVNKSCFSFTCWRFYNSWEVTTVLFDRCITPQSFNAAIFTHYFHFISPSGHKVTCMHPLCMITMWLCAYMKPGAVTSVPYKSLMIDSLVSDSYKPSCTVHSRLYNSCRSSHFGLVSFTVVVRTRGQWRMMICVLYKRGAAGALNAGLCGTYSTTTCLIESHTSFPGSPFLLTFVLRHPPLFSLSPPAGCASRPTWAPEGFRTSALNSDSSSTWWWTRPSRRTSSLRAQWRTSTARP